MAYPFIDWPTFGAFRQRLVEEFGCEYHEVATINSDRVNRLRRTVDGDVRDYGVTYGDDERVTPTVLRSICRRLDVDVKEFGLNLG